jgi:hypothetical protein
MPISDSYVALTLAEFAAPALSDERRCSALPVCPLSAFGFGRTEYFEVLYDSGETPILTKACAPYESVRVDTPDDGVKDVSDRCPTMKLRKRIANAFDKLGDGGFAAV